MPAHSAWGTDPDQPITFDDFCAPDEVDASSIFIPPVSNNRDVARNSYLDTDWSDELGDEEFDDYGNLIVDNPTGERGVPMRFSRARNPRLARAFERRRKVVEMKIEGYTFAEIAMALGFNSVDGCRQAFLRAQRDVTEVAEEWRTIQLARYEAMTKILWPMIDTGDLEAMDKYVKIAARVEKITHMDKIGPVGHGAGERGETAKDVVERIQAVEDVNQFLAALPGLVALSPQPAPKVIDEYGNEVDQTDDDTDLDGEPTVIEQVDP